MLYISGENLYISARYDRATEVFRNYLTEFPNGSFRQNAQYYLAECYKTTGNTEEALKLYSAVAAEPNNQFMEQSLLAASTISFDKDDFTSSLDYYERLEKAANTDATVLVALKGQLRSAYEAENAQKTISVAGKINGLVNVPEELIREATFMSAKALYSLNNLDEALKQFRKISKEVISAEGAESKYRVAELLYKKDQVTDAEKVITEFINQNTPHQFWMARIFLLLADISIKKGDTLQARATLQSLKDYYTIDNDGILDEVKSKLDTLSDTRQPSN